MKRRIAVNSNCYHGYSIEEAIEGIHKAGFKYIELTATKGWTEHVFPTHTFQYLQTIKDLLREKSLTPFAMSGHCNLMDRDRIKDFIDNIHLAHFFGCEYIVSSIGEAHLEDKAEISDREVGERIRELIPVLEDARLTLVLETHGNHSTGKRIKEITEYIGSPLVKVNFDTANVIYFGNVDPAEDLKESVSQVGYIHLKDKAGANNEWNFPALGMGNINFPHIFQILNEAENNAPCSIEIEFTQAGPKDLAEINTAVAASYRYLASIGIITE